MPIHVTVRDLQAGGACWQARLPEPLATIGRNASCDLVLHDPDKHVSRLHATLELRDGRYYLTAKSQINPVMLDGAVCPPDSAVPLRDGACITMHPFELTVRFDAVPARASAAAPAAAAPVVLDAFAWLDAPPSGAAPGPTADPFGLNHLQSRSGAGDAVTQADPFQIAPARQSASALVPDLSESAPAPAASLDPLQLLGGAAGAVPHLPLGGAPVASAVSLDAILGSGFVCQDGGAAPLVDFGRRSAPRGAPALDHVHDFQLPLPAPRPDPSPSEADAAPAPVAPADINLDWLDLLVPRPPAETAPPAAPATTPRPAPPPAGTDGAAVDSDGTAVGAFLRGLGDAGVAAGPARDADLLGMAGEIVRVAVHGLHALLLARAEIKKQLRAEERTMLASHANNPLKFIGSPQEALRFLFDPAPANAGAFLPPVQAIEDACAELLAHELGLVAGARGAVTGAIKRFDPAALERQAGKIGGLMQLNRKAKLWDMYVEQYDRVQSEMADNLDHLFERDFLDAYTEQVRRVKKES